MDERTKMFELDGKVALVTGAGQNVGAGIARVLAAQGATVVVNDFHADRAERTAKEIVAAGGAARPLSFDVSDFDAVTAAVADIAAHEGRVDILVNNAGPDGPMTMAPFSEMSADSWGKPFAVNVYGMLNCCKAVIGGMIDRGHGRIVTITSGAGQQGLDIGVSTYAAAKAGQIGFMRHLAAENGPHGITCNTVSLGLVLSDAEASAVQRLVDSIPVRRMGKPEDPGYLIAYLVSDEASWITGQTVAVNGGGLMI
ncbi:SDR family NAD(P)-dependent oxidoreductase [Sphaerisporangium krabiense]|uniref:3-oxoacyl-[acyl-carrier protein] reductase n=1 Tax=Sphaerisporangium krabiense TaxID=763782 RepID=A0A7W8Z642_9ACTN|nr:SDR family NAD(P)-dependent oxidoreductase [Sphaerisporangium krabiense]MBB5628052.1 3-oxoacyl-[acyl-carrier protein] reductase [Sphaerisporangium krabiense]